jgi:hypothetical protein
MCDIDDGSIGRIGYQGFHHLVRVETSNKSWHAIYVVIDGRWSLAAFNYKLYGLVNGQRSRHSQTRSSAFWLASDESNAD